jgi:ABC-type Co2+ transport system permease subunit
MSRPRFRLPSRSLALPIGLGLVALLLAALVTVLAVRLAGGTGDD